MSTDFATEAANRWKELLPEIDTSHIDIVLGVRLVRFTKLLTEIDDDVLSYYRPYGITGVEDFRTMSYLVRGPEEGMTNTDLVLELRGSRAGMSDRLERFVRDGLARRDYSHPDGRTHYNLATEKGHDLTRRMVRDMAENRKRAFVALSDEQKELLAQFTQILNDSLFKEIEANK